MGEPLTFDEHSERLQIRSNPRPTTRINRKVLMFGGCLMILAIFTGMSMALQPPSAASSTAPREVYNTANTRKPDALNELPASYSDTRAIKQDYPILGPPLSGDLGATMLQAERAYGIEPASPPSYEQDFRPNPAAEAERARKLKAAALEEKAAGAPVFFQLTAKGSGTPSTDRPRPASDPGFDLGSELLALAAQPGRQTRFGSSDPNLQNRKSAFASNAPDEAVYNPHSIQDPASPYQVMAGTLIPASLITGLNSDLPGQLVAQVTQPVFDTVTGQHLLIPQGSRLIGRYQSEVSIGQSRALLVWERLIFPDGSSIVISAPGADASGYAGLSGKTDHHWDRVFIAAGLATILGIGTELGNDGSDIERAIRRGSADTLNQAGQRAVERNLDIQPTIRVQPGTPLRVVVTRDLILRPQGETR